MPPGNARVTLDRKSRATIGSLLVAFVTGAAAAEGRSGDDGSGTAAGRIGGAVQDDRGRPVAGAVIAATDAAAAAGVFRTATDAFGRFAIDLPPGDYLVRASRAGYRSTYRETVRVQPSALVRRTITLWRDEPAQPSAPDPVDHAHSPVAWRLRRLTRIVLRDEANAAARDRVKVTAPSPGLRLDGHVNWLASSEAAQVSAWRVPDLPRQVASFAIGGPVGLAGRWRMRGTAASGWASSWGVDGEYVASADSRHAWRVGLVSSGRREHGSGLAGPAPAAAFRMAGVYADDTWRPAPRLEATYGARIDRYEYLAVPVAVSGHALVRVSMPRGASARVRWASAREAPGAAELLPPLHGGAWLPPGRSVSTADPELRLRAQETQHVEAALDHRLLLGETTVLVELTRFEQRVAGQTLTEFETRLPGTGPHRVTDVGDVAVRGWGLGAGAELTRGLTGRVEYVRAGGRWEGGGDDIVRRVVASVEGRLAASDTRVRAVYMHHVVAGGARRERIAPVSGRFDVEVQQALPFEPFQGGRLEVLVALRTLVADARSTRSLYDELLAARPPLRVLGGVQIRF